MQYRKMILIGALLCALLVLILGCSSNGSPVIPGGEATGPGEATPDIPRAGEEYSSSHVCWGVYEIRLNSTDWTAEATLNREAVWHANIIGFLTPPICDDCLLILNFGPGPYPDTAKFDGKITHPFAGDPNLDGFDVRAIGILAPLVTFPSGMVATPSILNADGFTNLWNESQWVPNSDINPFRAFWTNTNMRRFESGQSDMREFIFQFPEPGTDFFFDIAVDASYEWPHLVDPDDPATSPNSWEPFEITAWMKDENINDVEGNEQPMVITVYDWQLNPGPVTIEAPDLFYGSVDAGDCIDQTGYAFTYEVPLTNAKAAAEGRYPVLLKCIDSFDASVPELDLIAFNIFWAKVEHYAGPLPPVAVGTADKPFVIVGENVHFDGTESYDPDGEISTYAWDLNNDTIFETSGAEVDFSFNTIGEHLVDLMVTDNDGLWDTLDSKIPIWVNPSPNDPPVAIHSSEHDHTSVGGYIQFYGHDSYDPDGEISVYAWDLDSDGEYGEHDIPEEHEEDPLYQYMQEGVYYVMLRVTDNEGAEDYTDFPLAIDVSGENIPPVASGTASCYTPVPNKGVVFTSTSDDPDGFITKWEWNFDDGQGWIDFTESQGNTVYIFTEEGTYNIDHRVTDSAETTDSLDSPLVIDVVASGFGPPAPYDCSSMVSTHTYHNVDNNLDAYDHSLTYDVCGTPGENWILGCGGKLIVLDQWGDVEDENFHTMAGQGPVLLSIDLDEVNNRYAYVYDMPDVPSQIHVIDDTGVAVATIDTITVPRAVCFDWDGNVWLLDENWDIRIFKENNSFIEDPCIGATIAPLEGRVYDMAVNFNNHACYIFAQGADGLGQLVKINHDGTLGGSVAPVFDYYEMGYSTLGDIIIDNSSGDATSDCRIEVFSGEYIGGVARFDSELNLGQKSYFSFWGCKAAGYVPALKIVIVLEACCAHYFDRYLAPSDW